MCKIEEQATKNFMSKEKSIMVKTNKQEKREKDKKNSKNFKHLQRNKKENLSRPMEPSLSIRLAKIIEEGPEADTCALVNQKCIRKTGNFEIKIKPPQSKIKDP